jgi:hypothetical protein
VIVLAPPFVAASLYTAVAVRFPRFIRALAPYVLIAATLVALASYSYASDVWSEYANFVPWLIASLACAILSIVALALASSRRDPYADGIDGRIATPGIVAGFALHSWLRGPEPFVREHEVHTPRGIARVPATARLISPLPRSTTVLRSNEGTPVLSGGDRVWLVGFVPIGEGSPFREAHALIPGEHPEIHVLSDDTDPREQLVLAAWRPAIAYLVVLLAIAGPGLITLNKAH